MFAVYSYNPIRKSDLYNVARKIFREEDEMPLFDKAVTQCEHKLSRLLIDENTGYIAGFALVCKKPTKYYFKFMKSIPNCYELAFLGVSPEYQGCGIGSRLLKETLLELSQLASAYTCWLLVDTINEGAIRLYERVGFRRWRKTDEGKTPLPGYIMGISKSPYYTRSAFAQQNTGLLSKTSLLAE